MSFVGKGDFLAPVWKNGLEFDGRVPILHLFSLIKRSLFSQEPSKERLEKWPKAM
jgi:hypothetical protein